jgi:hypothetical protein
VVLYEKTKGTGEHRVHRVHHVSASRATFEAGIRDAAHQALIVLRHQESAPLRRTQPLSAQGDKWFRGLCERQGAQ